MERIVVVTEAPLEAALAEGVARGEPGSGLLTASVVADGAVGAWLDFYGVVRAAEPDGTLLAGLDYEAYVPMAVHQLHLLLDRLEPRYPLSGVAVVHRIGFVPVGEPSLLVRILSPHREEALAACAQLIDELKREVPIWKHPR